MSWKQRSISIFRQTITDRLFQNLKGKNFLQKSGGKTRQQSSDCCPTEIKSLFDEATVPEGCWSENYKRRDAIDSKILYGGLIFFLITMGVVQTKGLAKGHPEISLLMW